MVLFPAALRPGDRVAVLSPAGPVRDRPALDRGLERLRGWGLEPELLPNAMRQLPYPAGSALAGSDEERAADLQTAIGDRRYRAVLCTRGGYGCTRLLPLLDLTPLRGDPKPILGYSDVTALLLAAWSRVRLVGFHGPMVATADEYAMGGRNTELQRRLLTDAEAVPDLHVDLPAHVVVSGSAEGRLLGGNLTLFCALLGTPWQPDTEGALLFFEDVGEAPYRIDRMLTQLRQAGVFDRCAGVLCGDFHLDGTALGSEQPEVSRVLHDRLGDLGVPVASGFPIGHRPRSWTVPVAVRARLSAEDPAAPASLRLLEPAVVAE